MLPLALLPVLLLPLRGALVDGVAEPLLTFRDTDPVTGKAVDCERCPPGTYVKARCTATQKSVCAPCPPGSFTELWNYIGKCLRCGVCGQNQVETTACSADSDCRCQCQPGFYYRRKYDMCLRHSTCPPGQEALTPGSANEDTVCRVCPNGTFSDTDSAVQNCTEHQSCAGAGLEPVLPGAAWHDSICTSCQDLPPKDGGDFLKEILPAFFVHHRMSVRRLRRIVHKLPSEDGRKRGATSGLDASELQERIDAWVAAATATQIRQLPGILTKAGANGAGERLQNKLRRIDSHVKALSCSMRNEVDADLK